MTIQPQMIDNKNIFIENKHYCNEIVSRMRIVVGELQMPNEVLGRAIRLLRSTCVIVTMTTPDHAAGACLAMAVYSLGLHKQYRIFSIAKKLGVSSTAITSRIYKVLASRGIAFKPSYRDIQRIIASSYGELTIRK